MHKPRMLFSKHALRSAVSRQRDGLPLNFQTDEGQSGPLPHTYNSSGEVLTVADPLGLNKRLLRPCVVLPY
jgi:hypothetical protein